MRIGNVAPNGAVALRTLPGGSRSSVPMRELALLKMLLYGLPWPGLAAEVFLYRLRNLPNFMRGFWRITVARLLGLPCVYGRIALVKLCADGREIDYGIA